MKQVTLGASTQKAKHPAQRLHASPPSFLFSVRYQRAKIGGGAGGDGNNADSSGEGVAHEGRCNKVCFLLSLVNNPAYGLKNGPEVERIFFHQVEAESVAFFNRPLVCNPAKLSRSSAKKGFLWLRKISACLALPGYSLVKLRKGTGN